VLRDNQLSELPDIFTKLNRLSHLHVQGNALKTLPTSLSNTRLGLEPPRSSFSYTDNPLDEALIAVISSRGLFGLFELMRSDVNGGDFEKSVKTLYEGKLRKEEQMKKLQSMKKK
jgi:Leucine-rich repeat (LRR) protein